MFLCYGYIGYEKLFSYMFFVCLFNILCYMGGNLKCDICLGSVYEFYDKSGFFC